MPEMTHPDSKQTIDASPDQVPMYESQGWSKSSDVKK
jgi:hypothetical protein